MRLLSLSTSKAARVWSLATATILAAALFAAIAPRAFAATGANFVATGHDMDYHCSHGEKPDCEYLKILVDKVRNGSALPILAIDQGTELPTALADAGFTGAGEVVTVDPTNVAFSSTAFVNGKGEPLYSAIITASDETCGGCDDSLAGEANINARAADFAAFFNGGGGILALAGAKNFATYYNFVPLKVAATAVAPPFTVTPEGAGLGITSGMANCCITHNSFSIPPSPFVVLETDVAANAETIAAFNTTIGGGGFGSPPKANIPYVAWVGEHIRLVACDPTIKAGGTETQFSNWSTEDWSGYQFQPPSPDGDAGNNLKEEFNPGPSAFFKPSDPSHAGEGCVATVYKSLNPGLARVKVDVRSAADPGLTAYKPTLNEAGLVGGGSEVFQRQLTPEGKARLAQLLGDPSGNGVFVPSPFEETGEEDRGLIQVRVTGSFPVVKESPLSNILPGPSYTLPTDWRTLAETLSSSNTETDEPGDNPLVWDIHGSPGESSFGEETKVGTSGNVCTTASFISKTSSTDNCNGGEEHFSRVPGDLTFGVTAGTGPFDPLLANQTLLSDGRINADDAPMPSMRLDVAIAPRSVSNPLGGVGTLEHVLKTKIYSHDFTGSASAHNLYNPYYRAYLPATDRPGFNEVSGVAGPDHGSDFPGFLNEHPGPYNFWGFVKSFTSEHSNREEEGNGCLRRVSPRPIEFESPKGHLIETLYTDERGEAYVMYKPGDAFYLKHLLETGEIETTADGCDLQGVFEKPLGNAHISARAIYPYEPVDYPSVESEPVTKTVISRWEKEWFTFPKCSSKSTSCASARIIVAKAQDIDGRPIVGELVCFAVGGFLGAEPFEGELADLEEKVFPHSGRKLLHLGGTGPATFPAIGQLCLHTNAEGLAAIELDNGNFVDVDLLVNFKDEGVIRDHVVELDPPPPASPSTSSTTATTAAGGVSGSTSAAASKPLTPVQKLHKALKACKKMKSKKRSACESKARKAYAAATRKSKKK